MIYKISDNIISPLGYSSEENYENMKKGLTKGTLHHNAFGLPEPFYGSLLNWDEVESQFAQLPSKGIRYTRFEKLAILSAHKALEKTQIDPSSKEVLFVLSSTKGNIQLLENLDGFDKNRINMGVSADLLGAYFGNPNPVMVISNACTSGVVAQIYAKEMMEAKGYNYAVVVGADILCKFVISGFQSFKALSPEQCKPFDLNRQGLNLGEGAATIILQKGDSVPSGALSILGTGNRNDANHISGPSRTGEGLFNAITATYASGLAEKASLSFINAHGTATPYNDDMESWAISRSGLEEVYTNSLKGFLGHTLGAAGVLECVISCHALKEGVILPTLGHETKGVVKEMTVNTELRKGNGTSFLKIISGFGGSNAAIIYGIK